MTTYLAGIELKNSAAEKFAGTFRNCSAQERQNEPFQDLLAPAKPQICGRHPKEQRRTENFENIHGELKILPDEVENPKRFSECSEIDLGTPKSSELAAGDPSEKPTYLADPLPLDYVPIMTRLMPSTNAQNESNHEKPANFDLTPEAHFISPVQGKMVAASKTQGVLPPKIELESPSQTNVLRLQSINYPTSDAKSSIGSKSVEPPQVPNFGAGGLLSSFNISSTHALNLTFPGSDFSNTDKVAKEVVSNIAGSRDITFQLVNDMRTASNSRSLLVQMDLPEMGKITARFGGHADTLSMTLTSKDETMALSVAEVQRDMKVWLDQVNLHAFENEQLAGTSPESSNEYQKGYASRENKNKNDPSGTSDRTFTQPEGLNDAVWNQPQPLYRSARKWRLI
jgi:hypothetical protein